MYWSIRTPNMVLQGVINLSRPVSSQEILSMLPVVFYHIGPLLATNRTRFISSSSILCVCGYVCVCGFKYLCMCVFIDTV